MTRKETYPMTRKTVKTAEEYPAIHVGYSYGLYSIFGTGRYFNQEDNIFGSVVDHLLKFVKGKEPYTLVLDKDTKFNLNLHGLRLEKSILELIVNRNNTVVNPQKMKAQKSPVMARVKNRDDRVRRRRERS